MALQAAAHRRGRSLNLVPIAVEADKSLDHLRENVVEAAEDLAATGMVAGVEFGRLLGVALAAIRRCHDSRNQRALVFVPIDVARLGLVTLQAADA